MTPDQTQAENALFEVWWCLQKFHKTGAGKDFARLAWMARAASQHDGAL